MSPITVSTVDELSAVIELKTVRVYEISARRRDGFDMEEIPVDPNESELHVSQMVSEENLVFRARMELSTKQAQLKVDIGAIFTFTEPISEPDESVLDEFSQAAGLPTTLPYLRVYIQQAARQIGVPAPLLKHYWRQEIQALAAQGSEAEDASSRRELPPSAAADS